MKHFLFFIFLVIIAITTGILIAHDPGYAYFSYQHWSVEMPLWLAATLLLFIIFFTGTMVSAFKNLTFATWRIKQKIARYHHKKAATKINEGFSAYMMGDMQTAQRYFIKSGEYSSTPFVNYIFAAKALALENDWKSATTYFEKALKSNPGAHLTIELVRAQLLEPSKAEVTLTALLEQYPKNPQLLKLLYETYQKMDDWSLIASLLPTLKHHRVLPPVLLLSTEKKVHRYNLQQAATRGLEPLQHYWKNMSGLWKKEHDLVYYYATLLSTNHADSIAESILREFLKKEWQPELVYHYGLLITDNPAKLLQAAEKWLKHHPQDAILLLTLGRLSLRCELWGKAQEYLDLSIKSNPSQDAYQLLATLAERQGDNGLALQLTRAGVVAGCTVKMNKNLDELPKRNSPDIMLPR